ncbi:hypothetical protein GCM10020358_64150 [Amorphoplanes nipponensis]|uniref:hypothetical protein n=1 Tax=Actinoplanes nipponensis TaxID=135950 RepID=UPI001944E688|nr:hypothetical protein [Actinoplanes nipponensis]
MTWLDLIGWTGSALLVWSLLQNRLLRLRALNLLGCLVLIGFNAAVGVWPMVGLNVVLTAINIWYLARMLVTRHDTKAYQVVEVRTDDDFLAHTLRLHDRDIARFNPGLRWDAKAGNAAAFLIVNGDEVVGVVLFRTTGDGVAQVELDYVTPRYRDFTPGEFVYRQSQYFRKHGCRTVVTPPGMVSPYYGKLGFRREGDSYVLDLPQAPAAV